MGKNIEREKRIVAQMIEIHCRAKHKQPTLCDDCKALVAYSHRQLESCRYGEQKSACNKCPTHCYKPLMRTQISEVMRFSGKRMILRSPLDALWHLYKTLH